MAAEQKKFTILYDGIGAYEDETLENETFSVMLEKDSVISGRYINDSVVLLEDEYNVYCSSINVEPIEDSDPAPSTNNNDNKHEYDSTVIIHVEEVEQLSPNPPAPQPEETEDRTSSNDYVVVDDQKFEAINASDAATSEFETINPSDVQSSDAGDTSPELQNAPKPPPTPPPPPAVTANNDNDDNYDNEDNEQGYDQDNEDSNNAMIPHTHTTGTGMPLPPPPLSPSLEPDNTAIEPQIEALPPPMMDTALAPSVAQEAVETRASIPPPAPQEAAQQSRESIPPPVPADAVQHIQTLPDAIEEEEYVEVQNTAAVAQPPPVPLDVLQNVRNAEEYDEDDDDDMAIVQEINAEYAPVEHRLTVVSTLEDLDNLLRMYRRLAHDKDREDVYKEFWDKYDTIVKKKSYLLLQVPAINRGFLHIMSKGMEPYRRDRIMKNVLSRNGLLEEPAYIDSRYLFSYFIQYEIFNYIQWWFVNCASVQSWMFFFLMLLIIAEILHIGVDFGSGNPWRAVLMQCLVPLTFIAAIQFVNTPFTANILRTLIENKCAALCTVYGRVSLNLLIIFFCMGSLEVMDALLLFCAFCVAIWTLIVFVSFSRLKHSSNYVRIATGTSKTLQEKFAFTDEDQDGVLDADELKAFFNSFNQVVPKWQIELMISEYDVHRDNGLRFDALNLWFQKLPICNSTRRNLLANKSGYDQDAYANAAGVEAMRKRSVGADNRQQITTGDGPQYTEAEKEYMNLFVGRRGTMQ